MISIVVSIVDINGLCNLSCIFKSDILVMLMIFVIMMFIIFYNFVFGVLVGVVLVGILFSCKVVKVI